MGQTYKRSLAGEGGGTEHEVEKGRSRRLERGQGRNASKTVPDGSSYMVCFFLRSGTELCQSPSAPSSLPARPSVHSSLAGPCRLPQPLSQQHD